jgi:hypothetical protein
VIKQQNTQNPLNTVNISLTPPLNWDCIKQSVPLINFTDPINCLKIEDSMGWSCCHYKIIISGNEQNIKDFNAGGCLPVLSNITNNYTAYTTYMSSIITDNRDETKFVFSCKSYMFNIIWRVILLIILSFIF